MSLVADRLREAGFVLPEPPKALGAYVPAVMAGRLVFTAGQLPLVEGKLLSSGLVGAEVTLEVAVACAERCALNAIAAAATVCDLDKVERVVKLTGFVASAPGFTAQPAVLNGASDLLRVAFADTGAHARSAVGVATLPMDAPVEAELVLLLTE